MKRNLLLVPSNLYSFFRPKSLGFVFTLLLVLFFGSTLKTQAQCIGPYARFESIGSSIANTTSFTFVTSGVGSTGGVARSGLYYFQDGALNSSLTTPAIDNPNTFSFYVKGSTTSPTYSVEYSTDNFVTPIDITSATAIAAGVTYTKPAVSLNWQLVTVTFGTALNSSNVKLKIKDTYTRGTAATFYLDDISWTNYVTATSVIVFPTPGYAGAPSTGHPENTVIVPVQTGTNIAAPLGVCAGGTVTVDPTAVYNFYDNGGPSDQYNINQINQYVTFTPSSAGYTAGDRIRIQFISYTSALGETIEVWDDNGTTLTAATRLLNHTTTPAGPTITTYISTISSDGSITVKFSTNGGTNAAGFNIKVDCVRCSVPTGLASSSVGATSATVSWNATTAANYDVYYNTTGVLPLGAVPQFLNIASTSQALSASSALLTSQIYYVWVRSRCGSAPDSYSPWSPSINFTTVDCSTFTSTSPSTATQTLCLNTASTALTVSASGGTVSTYQWYSNTTATASGGIAVGTNSPSYTPLTTSSGTLYYYCFMTSNAGCTFTSAVSGAVTINPLPTATAGNNGPVCFGATLSLSGASSGGSGSGYSYSWNGPSSYSNGTQNPTVSASATAGMAGVYTLTVTDSNTCTNTSTTTVTVNATFATGTISSTGETICNGGTPATIASTTAASGGNTIITYSWRSSADGYVAAISGATGATYIPPSGLTTTTSYQRYANDGTCNTTPTLSSGTWTVTVNPVFTTGTIASTGETICSGGTPATTIGSTTAASGGDGSITYSWRSSADGYTAAIAGATSATYLPPSGLTATTSYRRYANDGSCTTTPTVSTGTWTVTVTNFPSVPSILAASLPTTNSFSANWSSVGGVTGYYLDVATDIGFTSLVSGFSNLSVGNVTTYSVTGLNASTTYYYRVRATNGNCLSSSSGSASATTTALTYCTPSGAGFPQDPNGITNVTMGTINNTTGIETNNYGNYTSLSTNVYVGATLPFSVTYRTGFSYDTNIWVDWNNDGDFADTGELVYQGNSTNAVPTILSGSFAVPLLNSNSVTTVGSHRLRIGGIDFGPYTDPCRNGNYQAFEDYTLTVLTVPPCAVSVASALTSINVTATSASLVWTDSASTPNTVYNYYVSTSNIAPPADGSDPSGMGTVTGVLTANVTGLTLGVTYYFWVRVKCNASTYSAWIGSATFTTANLDVVNMSTGSLTTCNAKFYDSGGFSSSYTISQDFTYTFIPSSGTNLKVVFNSFSTEPSFDYLYIYDGPNTSSTLLGKFSGSQIAAGQAFYSSTANGGNLTFRFTSDGSLNYAGWDADITCVSVPSISSFSPLYTCSGSTPLVTITGTNFTGASFVTFNGVAAAYTVVNSTTITATLPASATTGVITITTPNASGTSSTLFAVRPIPATPNAGADVAICSGQSTTLNIVLPPTTNSLATTQAGGNGCNGGNMFNIVTGSSPISITAFDITPESTAVQNVNVYYRTGTYVGSETTSGAWTLLGTYSVNGVSKVLINMPVTTLNLLATTTYGIYLNYDASYTTGANTYTNTDITINTGAGLCGAFSLVNASRTFNGKVYYQLSGTPTYSWSPAAGLSSTTISNPVASPTSITTYLVNTTYNGCTSANDDIVVSINPHPTSVLSGTQVVCSGSTANLSVALTGTGPWNITYTNGVTPVTVTGILSSPYTITTTAITSTTTYTVTAVSDSKCSASAGEMTGSAVLTNNTPTITPAAAATGVCYSNVSQTTTLAYSATSGTIASYSIVWNSSPSAGVTTVSNAAWTGTSPVSVTVPGGLNLGTNTATITVKNTSGCVSAGVSFTVDVSPSPNVTMTAPSKTVCYSASSQTVLFPYTGATGTNYNVTWNASPANSFVSILGATFGTAAGDITITVPAGTAGGIYTGTVTPSNASCGAGAAPRTITVTVTSPSITPAAAATSVCYSASSQTTPLTYSSPVSSPTTYTIVWNAAPANSFAAVSGQALPASPISIAVPAGTAAGTYTGTLSVANAGGCTGPGTTFTVTVNSNSGGTGSVDQSVCSVSQITDISVSGYSGSVTGWEYATTAGYTAIPSSASATLTAAQILALNLNTTATFRAVVSTGGCTATSTVVTMTFNSTTWDGSSWSNGAPTSSTMAIINVAGAYIFSGSFSACSLLVTSGNISIASGVTVSLVNEIKVSGGSVTFNNDASLLQTNNVANTGNITYNRTTTALLRFDYTYWSTPVSPQTIIGFTPLSPLAYTYSGAWASVPTTTSMSVAKGYTIRAPTSIQTTDPPTNFYASFVGVPNNGTYTTPIVAGNFNLIGNPYPSALMADEFLKLSNNPALDGTIYLWTHNTPINVAYQYTGSDYALYNLSGGVGTGTATTSTYSGVGSGRVPLGFIAAGQGFMIKGLSNGVANFTNAMRIGGSNNSQFFRTSNSSLLNAVVEKNRLWLDITNTEGAFKQVLVGYFQDATNGLDRGYDGEMVDIGTVITFYTTVDTKKLSIQGRALPFAASDLIPLGYKSTITGTYTIALSDFEGLFTSQNIYLEDTVTGEIHDMKSSAYTFATTIGTFENRFVLRFTTNTLGVPLFNANSVVVYKNDTGLHIATGNVLMQNVKLYDVAGRLIASRTNIGASETVFTTLPPTQQVLLVQITSEDGGIVTKKVVY